jgi:GTP-binding protein
MNVPVTSERQPTRALSRELPIVAIVGRPNVGKSTLFNRLIGERKAIVDDMPGVTRDRNYATAEWSGRNYWLVDTGGIESDSADPLERSVQAQSRLAIAEADLVIFLFDGKEGLNPADRQAVAELRRTGKPVFFAVNKLDSRRRGENLYEFFALGIERLYSISAEHGLGIGDLMTDVIDRFPDVPVPVPYAEHASEKERSRPLRVAIVGRPNVGKSTLINRLLGYERSVVDATPGTTRDSLDTPFVIWGEPAVLIDTAGIRRKARIDNRLEQYSVRRSLRAVDRGDLVVHVIDGPEGVTDQDAQILSYAAERGKALVLAVNKWDLISKSGAGTDGYRDEIRFRLPFLDYAPIAFISAATGHGLRKLLDTAASAIDGYRRKVPTAAVNHALQKIVQAHTPPLAQGRPVKFYYGTQTRTRPPTFALFVNRPAGVPESYKKYLMHKLRDELNLANTPIRLDLRARREADGRSEPRRHK